MKRDDARYLKNNQKGITLIELLVALAIGTIVLSALMILLRQSVKAYTSQTVAVRLQNDADLTLNQMCDNLMQTNMILLNNDSSTTTKKVTLGDPNASDVINSTGVTTYIFDSNEGKIYYADSYNASPSSYGIVCEHVVRFRVEIVNCKTTAFVFDDTTNMPKAVDGTMRIKVTLVLKDNNKSRTVTRTVNVRNTLTLDHIYLNKDSGLMNVGTFTVQQMANY